MEGSKVLDLFCGSGAVGFECVSRGADEVVFVDLNTQLTVKNAEHLKTEDSCRIIRADSMKYIESTQESFDFLFADPPYDFQHYDQLVLRSLLISKVTILEHPGSYVPCESIKANLILSRKAGKAHFSIFEQPN